MYSACSSAASPRGARPSHRRRCWPTPGQHPPLPPPHPTCALPRPPTHKHTMIPWCTRTGAPAHSLLLFFFFFFLFLFPFFLRALPKPHRQLRAALGRARRLREYASRKVRICVRCILRSARRNRGVARAKPVLPASPSDPRACAWRAVARGGAGAGVMRGGVRGEGEVRVRLWGERGAGGRSAGEMDRSDAPLRRSQQPTSRLASSPLPLHSSPLRPHGGDALGQGLDARRGSRRGGAAPRRARGERAPAGVRALPGAVRHLRRRQAARQAQGGG